MTDSRPVGRGWARRYPPLATLAVALVITLVVLPSALTLPNANPSTVLEYAPVPPEDDDPPPPQDGSLSTLGLGTSSSLRAAAPPPENPPRVADGERGRAATPITKRCVGSPLRQTEDPNAPPCVAHFEGDNGGATWDGVTADEITVILYHEGFISDENERERGDASTGEWTPSRGYCDLDKPSEEQTACVDSNTGSELSAVRAVRALSRYFNERFQTYDRHVHFYINWTIADSPQARRADASNQVETRNPFAVLEHILFTGYREAYAESITRRGVMLFSSTGSIPNSVYRAFAPNFYTFWPDVEHWADSYATYVCTKVRPFPVSQAGDSSMLGKPRKFGLMYTTDPAEPGLRLFQELVEPRLRGCGVDIAERATFPVAGYHLDSQTDPSYATANVAKLRSAGVTTVLWLGGMESKTTQAADAAGWYPEWVIAGDRKLDSMLNARVQNQRVFRHAWTVSHLLREDRFADSPARQALREADPDARQIVEYWASLYYRDMFTLFTAIQVAGPQLTPYAVDQGLHAIPRRSSKDPFVAACFYDPNDYSCVKDAHEAWWDPDAPDPHGEVARGCWRMVRSGRRYLAGEWEGGDDVFRNRSDPCNGFKGSVLNRAA